MASLRSLRVGKLWSIRDMREASRKYDPAGKGLSAAILSGIETGTRSGSQISFHTMRRVAETLGVDPLEVDEFRRALDERAAEFEHWKKTDER